MNRYRNILAAVASTPWAILPEKLRVITEFLAFKAAGGEVPEEDLQAAGFRIARMGGDEPAYQVIDGAAIIPIRGTISPRASLLFSSLGASTEQISAAIAQALDDGKVERIVLDINSPGGAVSGVPELAAEIRAARDQKPVIAAVNSIAASAAYWLAAQASRIDVTPSGQVGSIGVFSVHEDLSRYLQNEGVAVSVIRAGKYKAEGNPYEPLTPEARAEMQRRVDAFYGMFVRDVAAGRGVSVELVSAEYGQGRSVLAEEAVARGMADRVATFRDSLSAEIGEKRPRTISASDDENQLRAGIEVHLRR